MKVSIITCRAGLALTGMLALAAAVAPARASDSTPSSFGYSEGIVVAATDSPGTLTVHPAVGGNLVLKVGPGTHFRKAGGEADTPDEAKNSVTPQVSTAPLPSWFVGLFARAYYDKASFIAGNVALSQPEALFAEGSVDPTTTPTDLCLKTPKWGLLHLTLDLNSCVRLNGRPYTGGALDAGDLVQAMFWLTGGENEALRISARTPPPLRLGGVVSDARTDDGGGLISFKVTRGKDAPLTFTVDGQTTFWTNGKQGSATDLKDGEYAGVSYQSKGGANDAQRVDLYSQHAPKPIVPKPPVNPNGDGGNNGNTGGNTSGGGGGAGTGEKPPSKPLVTRPGIVEGLVSAALGDGSVFKVKKGNTELSFTVDDKTVFRINDKPATKADLALGQLVHVYFVPQPDGTLLAKGVPDQQVNGFA